METDAAPWSDPATYPVQVEVEGAPTDRNRLTTAFRAILAIPHILLVGTPFAASVAWEWGSDVNLGLDWGAGTGILGAFACLAAIVMWFAIVITGRHVGGIWSYTAFYLRWRVRAIAYLALLRDEYPPFDASDYPVALELAPPTEPRNRLTVAFRILLAFPHLLILWALGLVWLLITIFAWFAILFTGKYPAELYDFAVGVLRWNMRVEAYVLLLRDEYPPFSLR